MVPGNVDHFTGPDNLHDLAGESVCADSVAGQVYLVNLTGQLGNRSFQAIHIAMYIRQQAYSHQ
jgi:hypothetical protein